MTFVVVFPWPPSCKADLPVVAEQWPWGTKAPSPAAVDTL